jgi:MFS family permease
MMGGGAEQVRRGWYHGWNIVVVCVLAQVAANGLPINAFSLFLHDWSVDLKAPISSLQLSLAALGLFSAIFSPLVGPLADKYPARRLMGGGILGIAAFYIALSFVQARWQFLVLFMIVLPLALVFSTTLVANACVSRWFTRRLGLALGLTAFGLGAAGVILPPLVAHLTPELGWRGVWRGAGAIIGVVVLPLVLLVMRDRPTARDGLDYVNGDGARAAFQGHPRITGGANGLGWRDVLASRNFRLLVAVYLPMLALHGAVLHNLAPIATSRALSQQTAGALLSAFSFSHVTSTLIAGMLADRFGNRLPLVGLAMATAAGGILVALAGSEPLLFVGVLLVGLSGGMWPLLASAVAAEFGASHVGRSFGLLMMFLPLIGLMPSAVARIQEHTGSYAPGLCLLAALTCAGGAACLFMRERRTLSSSSIAVQTEPAHQ